MGMDVLRSWEYEDEFNFNACSLTFPRLLLARSFISRVFSIRGFGVTLKSDAVLNRRLGGGRGGGIWVLEPRLRDSGLCRD